MRLKGSRETRWRRSEGGCRGSRSKRRSLRQIFPLFFLSSLHDHYHTTTSPSPQGLVLLVVLPRANLRTSTASTYSSNSSHRITSLLFTHFRHRITTILPQRTVTTPLVPLTNVYKAPPLQPSGAPPPPLPLPSFPCSGRIYPCPYAPFPSTFISLLRCALFLFVFELSLCIRLVAPLEPSSSPLPSPPTRCPLTHPPPLPPSFTPHLYLRTSDPRSFRIS